MSNFVVPALVLPPIFQIQVILPLASVVLLPARPLAEETLPLGRVTFKEQLAPALVLIVNCASLPRLTGVVSETREIK